jgi:F0F1-type ATP synthase delta subunit
MKVRRRDLATVIAEETLHEKSHARLAESIAAYLLVERRTNELEPLLRDIMQYRLDHGIVEAEIGTARELPARIAEDVKRLLKDAYPQAKRVDVHTRQDEQLVGGVLVRLPNEQFDDSVRGKLNRFKQLIKAEG